MTGILEITVALSRAAMTAIPVAAFGAPAWAVVAVAFIVYWIPTRP